MWSQISQTVKVVLFSCLLIVIALSRVAQADGSTPARDKVVAAYYPPLMIDTDAKRPGIAVEIIRKAANLANRSIDIEFLPFRRAMATVQARSDVLMPALFRNDERERKFTWVAELFTTKLLFLSLDTPINTLKQARALKAIGVEAGSTGDQYLTEHGFTNLVHVSDPDASAYMLQAGRIDGWLLTKPLAETVWTRLGFREKLLAGSPILELPIYVVGGLRMPDATVRLYRNAIGSLRAAGEIEQIRAKYR
ncbi:MAG: transporter substrate-binding domain-containing protein [Pseudomonadota bacterium]